MKRQQQNDYDEFDSTKFIKKSKWLKYLKVLEPLFFWLRVFYPDAKGYSWFYLLYTFFPQKVLRINGWVSWPVHFTSMVLNHKNITVGAISAPGYSPGCYIQGRGGINIGNNVIVGPNVGLISANHSPDDYDIWLRTDPIVIGDNVWIGMNAVIMPGVTIGNNVIVGANSVVTKDIPDDVVVAGVPCKVIKKKSLYKGKYDN